MKEPLRVLLVGTSPAVAEGVADALQEVDQRELFLLLRASSLAEAVERLDREEADVALLSLPGPEGGVLALVELRAAAPEIPVVVIASAADEPLAIKAVHLGAADYLIAEKLYGTLVARCIQHAVEVERVRSQLRMHEASWAPSMPAGEDGEGRAAPLRLALPRGFEDLVGSYDRILEKAVEQILYRVEHPLERDLRNLARRAGELRAGPRDVIEIHSMVMKSKEHEAGPQRMRLYIAEGRVRVLELMGHLAAYYRHLSLPRRYRSSEEGLQRERGTP